MKPRLVGQLEGPNVKFNGRFLTANDLYRVIEIFEDSTTDRQKILDERYGRANVHHGPKQRADQMIADCQDALAGSLAARRRVAEYVKSREIAAMRAGHPPRYWAAGDNDV